MRRPIRGSAAGLRRSPEKRAAAAALAALLVIAVLLVTAGSFLKKVSGDMALSDASDLITATINDKINERMRGGLYDYDYFVSLQKDNNGNITAISANMARINTLSSEILRDVISATNSGLHDLHIPLGNLLGMNLLMGRGPRVPVRILMLTSSYADFRNELAAAGINQIKHQIILEVRVEIDVLLPWELRSTEVVSEVLIAETVIVGKVPEAYLSMVSP
ncbi:MAG: sporulation protein YunB [Oscillospiraceae bacterium]|nr:sporulation protein YunB [Oscillospiraceae bacterium]